MHAGVASYPSGCWSVALTVRLKAFPIGLHQMMDGMVTGAGAGHEAIVVLSEKEKYLI